MSYFRGLLVVWAFAFFWGVLAGINLILLSLVFGGGSVLLIVGMSVLGGLVEIVACLWLVDSLLSSDRELEDASIEVVPGARATPAPKQAIGPTVEDTRSAVDIDSGLAWALTSELVSSVTSANGTTLSFEVLPDAAAWEVGTAELASGARAEVVVTHKQNGQLEVSVGGLLRLGRNYGLRLSWVTADGTQRSQPAELAGRFEPILELHAHDGQPARPGDRLEVEHRRGPVDNPQWRLRLTLPLTQ